MLNSTTSKFRLRLKNQFTFDVSMKLDRTLAQRKAERYAKSKVKVTQCILAIVRGPTIPGPQPRWGEW